MNSNINDKELSALGADEQMRTMRAELNALKEGLRAQKITTEMMLRSAIGSANRAVRRMVCFNLPAVALVSLFCGYLNVEKGFVSHALAWATVALLAGLLAANAFINWISTSDVTRLPLAELQQKLKKRRKRRFITRNVGMAVAAVWFVWVIVELSRLSDGSALVEGVIIGGLVGGLIGTRHFRRFQRADAELIEQIGEMDPGK